MAPLISWSRTFFARITSIRVLGCALASGLVATAGPVPSLLAAQAMDQTSVRAEDPNYRLAGRFAPYKIRELIHSTSVEPNWIEKSERFWYSGETGNGKNYYLVDPQAGTKTAIFDNDRIAAELTRITLDPWDGKHLPIRSIRFIDENTLQFEVVSSQDDEDWEDDDELEDQEEEEQEGEEDDDEGKILFHFEYDVTTRTLRELADWEGPDNHPSWASVSPDGQTVVFARNHNLQMMTGGDYAQILDARRGESGDDADEAEEDVEIDDVELTTDGEEDYSMRRGERGPTDAEREKDKDQAEEGRYQLVQGLPPLRPDPPGPPQLAGPVGHPLDGQQATRAGDLQVRSSGRHHGLSTRDPDLRYPGSEPRDREHRRVAGPTALPGQRPPVRVPGQRGARRPLWLSESPTRSTTCAEAATNTGSTSWWPTPPLVTCGCSSRSA